MKKISLVFSIVLVAITGCSIFGVHFHLHNPHRAGKFPKKTQARVLLGNQDTKYRTCYDVKYYWLNVDFGSELKKNGAIKGVVLTQAKATSDFDTLQFDLAENMTVDSVARIIVHDPDKKIKFTRKKGALFVIMDRTIKTGEQFTIAIVYHGIPTEAKKAPWSGGFVRKEDDLKKPWWGVACETEGASLWWPCKDVMNDEPDSVDISLTVPEGLKAISNGKLISENSIPSLTEKPNAKSTFNWHVSYPINIYNITFYIGNFKLLHDTYYSEVTHDTLQLNHYVLEQNYEKAKTHFQQLKKYLAFYEATFGPYPWYRDGYKLVESPYEGMEHQSAIAYGNGYKNDPLNGWDYIILHETAHEWWGNSVTANDLAEGWIHEGFATYAEALYVEKTKGYDAYIKYLYQYRFLIINRRPVVGEKGIRYFNYKDSDIYMKGAWILHSLRCEINNDSLFFGIIHSFYNENKYSQISSEKLEELVNRKTGKDFHWFFEQYLHNRFVPELEYCIKDNVLYYRWNPGYSSAGFNKMQIEAFSGYEKTGAHNIFTGTRISFGKLTPSIKIQKLELPPNNDPNLYYEPITFDDQKALYKATENKSLAKAFQKQKK
jgi:aminopeptidase N